jgi:hypothetical protein
MAQMAIVSFPTQKQSRIVDRSKAIVFIASLETRKKRSSTGAVMTSSPTLNGDVTIARSRVSGGRQSVTGGRSYVSTTR